MIRRTVTESPSRLRKLLFGIVRLWLVLGTYTFAVAADYPMNGTNNGGTFSVVDGDTFTDSGGTGANYSNSENYTITFQVTAGSKVRVEFQSFLVANASDLLHIHDGGSIAAPLIGNTAGHAFSSPGVVVSSGNQVTFRWSSDGSSTFSGWLASLSAIAPVNTGGIGSLVWVDTDNDGLKDAGESGLSGVFLELLDQNGTPVDNPNINGWQAYGVLSDGTGAYSFSGLPAGNYKVQIATPLGSYGRSSGTAVALDNQVDNDNNGIQTQAGGLTFSPIIQLADGETDNTVDFGFRPSTTSSYRYVTAPVFQWWDGTTGQTWNATDTSRNYSVPYMDTEGNPRTLDVTITLVDPQNRNGDDAADLHSAATHPFDPSGGAAPYPGSGETDFVPGDGSITDPWDSDLNPLLSQTAGGYGLGYLTMGIKTATSAERVTWRYSFSTPIKISGMEIGDIDGNGINRDAAVTSQYESPGNSYQDRVEVVARHKGMPVDVTIASGARLTSRNGTVYYTLDPYTNGDLLPTDPLGTTTMSTAEAITELEITYMNGGDDAVSEVQQPVLYAWWSGTNGATKGVCDDQGVRITGFGLVVADSGSISGTVLADTNADNLGDAPMSAVQLTLFTDPNGDGDTSDGVPADDPNQSGVQNYVVTTGADGSYLFTMLPPGNYVVKQTQPSGYHTVSDGDSTDGSDDAVNGSLSDNSIPATVIAGEEDTGNDFVEVQLGPCEILPTDILQAGYAIFSCKSNGIGTGAVGVRDIRATGSRWPNPANRGIDQSAHYPETFHWNLEDFGGNEVLGIAVDTRDNSIYVATTALYAAIGAAVPSQVYHISRDGSTVTLFATLPGNKGAGWIDIDEENDQLYVTDMDSGGIYVVPLSGGPGQTGPFTSYAPFALDAVNEGDSPTLANFYNWAPSGQRVMSVAYNPTDNRLYYSLWNTDTGTKTGNPNVIRSVQVVAGAIVGGTDQLVITQPNLYSTGDAYSSPVTDIAFDRSGTRMLLAEQTLSTSSFGIFTSAHQSRLLQAVNNGGTWVLDPVNKFGIGGDIFAGSPFNSRGGVSFAPGGGSGGMTSENERWVVATGDALNFQGDGLPGGTPEVYTYGFQFSPSGGAVNSSAAILVDLDNEVTNQDKAIYGDVDVRICPPPPVGLGNVVFRDLNRNGAFDTGTESGIAGVQVDLYDAAAVIGTDLPICSVKTRLDGSYGFYPIDPGSYKVHIPADQFDFGQPLYGLLSSTGNGIDNGTDDADDENGIDNAQPYQSGIVTPVIALAAGAEALNAAETGYAGTTDTPDDSIDFTWDFGFVTSDFGIGNLVFSDTNSDSRYTPGLDTPLAGVTVQLFISGQDPRVDSPVGTQVTDSNGRYLFANLGAGDYFVVIPAAEFNAGGDLAGYMSAPGVAFGDDDLGEDGGDTALPMVHGVRSGIITLFAGNAPIGGNGEDGDDSAADDLKDEDYDLTVDFAFVATADNCAARTVASGDDDGYELSPSGEIDVGGVNRLTRSFGVLGSGVVAGTRFSGLNIPQGSTITAAYVVFTANQLSDGAGTGGSGALNLLIRGDAADSTPAYTTTLFDFSDGADTTASVPWTISSSWAASVSDDSTTTPNLAAILQQIVNRNGWAPGNAISLTFENVSGTDTRRWETYNDTPVMAPQLVVCYTAPTLSVGNVVFHDLDSDGRYDAGEGVSGVTLQLFSAGGDTQIGGGDDVEIHVGPDGILGTSDDAAGGMITLADGGYLFQGLVPGSYFVRIPSSQFSTGAALEGLLSIPGQGGDTAADDDTDENGDDDLSDGVTSTVIALADNAEPLNETGKSSPQGDDNNTNLSVDFGFIEPATIIGTVFSDDDNDNDPDTAMGGVTVTLFTDPNGDGDPSDGVQVGVPVQTSPTGNYSFTGLVPGSYVVVQTQPPGYLTVTDGDTTDANDDLANPSTTDNRIPVAVTAGETDNGNDFVEELPASIGNLVWNDANNNGIRDLGEPGLSAVQVDLLDSGGGLITSTTSDVDGLYSFANLAPGSYQIRVPLPPTGYLLSSQDSDLADNQQDNDDNGLPFVQGGPTFSPLIALSTGESDQTIDFGFLAVATISGTVSVDNTGDVIPDVPLGGVTLALCDALGIPVDNPNLPGVQEYIITSQPDGSYSFTGFFPGTYQVKQTQPTNYLSVSDGDSTPDQPSSPVDPANVSTLDNLLIATVVSGETDSGNDFIERLITYSVGNLVFVDDNANGVADPGEGIDNITVMLRDGLGNDIDSDPITEGVQTTTILTSGGGFYQFSGLAAGTYTLYIPAAEFATGGDLAGRLSLPGHGTDNGTDDLDDENGIDSSTPWTTGISSPVITLGATEPTTTETGLGGSSDDGLMDTYTDLTLDFGFIGGKATSFGGWQQQNPLGGQNGPNDDPDGDGVSNLAEFAFCYDPSSGVNGSCPLRLVKVGAQVNAEVRVLTTSSGLSYTLQGLADLADSPTGWATVSTLPTRTAAGPGLSTDTYASISTEPAYSAGQGFFRILVTDAASGATSTSEVQGFTRLTHAVGCVSASVPYTACPIATGAVDALAGDSISVTTAAGTSSISAAFVSGRTYYVEITSGDNEGHRIEVDEAGSTATAIALVPTHARSTLHSLPASLAADTWALRQHRTINDLYPPSTFTGPSNNPSLADRLLIYNGTGYDIFWLYLNGGSPHWTLSSSSALADDGDAILDPCGGWFVHPKISPVTLIQLGGVRAHDMVCPIPAGSTMIGGGWPLNQSPIGRGMTTTSGFLFNRSPSVADKALIWRGDTNPSLTGYDSTVYLRVSGIGRWITETDVDLGSQDNSPIFKSLRAAIIKTQTAKPAYAMPLPWTP